MGETLAVDLELRELDEAMASATQPLAGGARVHVGLEKA
jgi:hypothetical protein